MLGVRWIGRVGKVGIMSGRGEGKEKRYSGVLCVIPCCCHPSHGLVDLVSVILGLRTKKDSERLHVKTSGKHSV